MLASEFVHAFFFFSSRRRHTRSLRDWSSDVCSSDLALCAAALAAYLLTDLLAGFVHFLGDRFGSIDTPVFGSTFLLPFHAHHLAPERSEERRVGKECRSRWSAYP